MSCSNCFKGTIHEGTPLGKEVKIQNRDTYVAEPPSTDATTPPETRGIIVIVSDAFGCVFGFLNCVGAGSLLWRQSPFSRCRPCSHLITLNGNTD